MTRLRVHRGEGAWANRGIRELNFNHARRLIRDTQRASTLSLGWVCNPNKVAVVVLTIIPVVTQKFLSVRRRSETCAVAVGTTAATSNRGLCLSRFLAAKVTGVYRML